jgi:Xaa-Pro aminopeptidase
MIIVKSREEIELMRESALIVSKTLEWLLWNQRRSNYIYI